MKRQANIELLRGLLMLMVVLVHLTGNGILSDKNPLAHTEHNWIIANIIDAICYPAVNCFILISGYFGLRPTIKKFLKLEIPIILYGFIAFMLINRSTEGAIHAFFPVLSKSYWFFTSYFMLLLVAPFLNAFVDSAERKQFKLALLLAAFLFIIIPSFSPFRLAESRGMDFVGFSLMYLIGRYIGKYELRFSSKVGWIVYLCATVICFSLTLSLAYVFDINRGWKSPFYAYNCVLVVIQSVALFYIFKNVRINEKWSKIINYLSPSFFFVYIIHENPEIHARLYLWISLEVAQYSESFICHTLGWAIIIFVACVLIDILLRRFLFSKIVDMLVAKCDKCVEKVLNHFTY